MNDDAEFSDAAEAAGLLDDTFDHEGQQCKRIGTRIDRWMENGRTFEQWFQGQCVLADGHLGPHKYPDFDENEPDEPTHDDEERWCDEQEDRITKDPE